MTARTPEERGDIECDVCGTMIPPGEVCSECGWGVNEHPVVH